MFDVAAKKVVQIAVPFVAALIVIAAGRFSAQAQGNHMLVIPASDGYDFDECLSGAKSCGRTIADAWCEAHGMSASLSFGRADDVTASLSNAAAPKTDGVTAVAAKVETAPKFAPGSFIVNCKD